MSSGNVFLNKVFGAEMILCPPDRDVKDYADEIVEEKNKVEEILISFQLAVAIISESLVILSVCVK